MDFKLQQPFAANSAVSPFDTINIKRALNQLSYYTPFEKTGITDIPDAGIFDAIKSFQKDNKLDPTGSIFPNDKTAILLQIKAAQLPKGKYIWRTVEDNHVRANHAKLNRAVRSWNSTPRPGADFNCRCWA